MEPLMHLTGRSLPLLVTYPRPIELREQEQEANISLVITEVKVLVTQLILCNPMEYKLPDSFVHNLPGKITDVGSHSLLHGIFPTQGLSPCLLQCR